MAGRRTETDDISEGTDPNALGSVITRRPVAFFNLTEDDLTEENLDATTDRIMAAIRERRVRRCRACGEQLPADAHPNRRYCSVECRRRRG